jgi:hypothetical protein
VNPGTPLALLLASVLAVGAGACATRESSRPSADRASLALGGQRIAIRSARLELEVEDVARAAEVAAVKRATIELQLQRRRILGPLGYLAKWIVWAVSKLFVIR